MKTFITLDDINDVIELFEDFLRERGVVIPTSEEDKREEDPDGWMENDAIIYEMDYGCLQFELLDMFERWHKKGKTVDVVGSWNTEVETWNVGEEK